MNGAPLRLAFRALALATVIRAAHGQVSDCAPCHAEIAASFAKTGMGRSFSRVLVERLPDRPYYHTASDTFFTMIERDGHIYQRRWQVGFDGNETNVEEKSADFVLGSGNHARTYLHLTARGTLQQLPLGWYAEDGGTWAPNPGYDRPDYPGSTRAISYECMGCHNAYPKIPAANREEGAEARYLAPLPEGIDCRRCHGPGTDHIATAGKAAIVNPKRLVPDRELEVCLQCHLETTSRLLPHSIQRHGRAPFSYAAGEPLGDFRMEFDRAPGSNTTVEIAGGAYRFRQSQCFAKSGGKLRCTTCHNPHDIPRGEAALAGYNRVCASCHTAPHRAGENCVGCHMPKTRTDDAVHVVLTDHRIQRVAGANPTAAKSEFVETPANSYRGTVVPYYPSSAGTLYEAVAQLRDGSNLRAGLPWLAAALEKQPAAQVGFYVDLAEAYRAAGDLPRAIARFETAAARAPASLVIPLKLASAQIEARRWPAAESTLRRAATRAPSDPLAWGLLGWSLWQQDKRAEARAALEKGIRLDPEIPELHNYLGSIFLGTGDRTAAEREFREAMRLEPGIAEWRANLAGLIAAQGRIPEARYHFEQSIRFKPGYAAGRFDYARMLAAIGESAEAEKHAQAAVGFDPKMPDAHELLGALLLNRGDYSGAQREFESALKLAPAFVKARYELGLALYSQGDRAAAIAQLEQAEKAGNPDAARFLRQIR